MAGRGPLLHLVDLLWSSLVITPLTVLGWRGLWDLLDQVFPNDPLSPEEEKAKEVFSAEISPWSAFASFLAGLVLKILLDLGREQAGAVLADSHVVVRLGISWAIRITQGLCMVAYWRGTFGLMSNNLGESLLSVSLVLGGSSLILLTGKLAKCAIFPPLVLITDSHQQTFKNGLYFRSSPGEQGFILLDSIFSNFVVKTVPALVWWSLWCLENKYFIHNMIGEKDEVVSYDSLIFGYILTIFVFTLDKLLPYKDLQPGVSKFCRLFISCLAILATLNVWRGVWSWLDHFFLPSISGNCNYSLGALLSIIGLSITYSTNTLGGDFIKFADTEDEEEVIDIQFWTLKWDSIKSEESESILNKN